MSEWLTLLKSEAERTSITDVARRIGYARPSVSLAIAGRYPGGTDALEKAVLAKLANRIACPFLRSALSQEECREHATKRMPTGNPAAFKHWGACQDCSIGKEIRSDAE